MTQLLENLADTSDAGRLLELTIQHFGAQTGTIHILERDGFLHLRALTGTLPPPVLEAIRVIPIGKGIAGLAVERREPVNVCNLQTDSSGAARPAARYTGVQGSICVPMMVNGQAIGALGIGTYQERTFTEEEVALLLAAGREIGTKLWSL